MGGSLACSSLVLCHTHSVVGVVVCECGEQAGRRAQVEVTPCIRPAQPIPDMQHSLPFLPPCQRHCHRQATCIVGSCM